MSFILKSHILQKMLLSLLALSSFSFLYSAAPSWVNSVPKDKQYYYVVGYTEDVLTAQAVQDKALQNAKGKIANSIFEETEVQKVFTASGNLSGNEELQKNYKEEVKSKSAVNLSGIEVQDTYTETEEDGGLTVNKVWVLTKISYKNLEKERTRILSEIQRKLALVDDNLNKAQASLDKGNIMDALNAYLAAAVSALKVKERVDEFPLYMNKMNIIMGNLFITAGENPEKIDTKKGGAFRFNLYYNGEQGKVPVAASKLNFILRNNDGVYTRSGVTSSNGEAVCQVTSIKDVKSDNQLYARLAVDFQAVADAGKDYGKYYTTLRDAAEKVSVYSSFTTESSQNRAIPTAVIAMVNKDSGWQRLPSLASEAQAQLLKKGYKVVKFSDALSLDDIAEAEQSALDKLSAKGIKRVFILSVSSDDKPKFNETVNRYIGIYSMSAQLIDTSNGEILSANNIKLTATSSSEKTVFDSFIKAAGSQLKKMIE